MVERRRYERFNLRLACKTTVMNHNQGGEKEIFNLFTKDICAGGAFFHSLKSLSKGRDVKIEFVLDFDTLKELTEKRACIKVKGKVIRTESKGIAVSFDKHYKITRI